MTSEVAVSISSGTTENSDAGLFLRESTSKCQGLLKQQMLLVTYSLLAFANPLKRGLIRCMEHSLPSLARKHKVISVLRMAK